MTPPSLYFSQGRFVEASIVSLLNQIHLTMFDIGFGFSGIVLVLYSALIVFLLKACVPEQFDRGLVAAAGLFIAASPLMATLLSYRQTAFNLAACLLLLLYGMSLYQAHLKKGRDVACAAASAVCFALSLGCYQVFISVIVLYFAYLSLTAVHDGRRVPCGNLVVPALSVVLYGIIFAMTKNIAGENHWDQRGALLSPADFARRGHDIAHALSGLQGLMHGHPSYAVLLLLPVLALSLAACRAHPGLTVLAVMASAVLCAVILFPVVGLSIWQPTARMFLGAYFAIGFAAIWLFGMAGLFVRGATALLVALSLVSMMFSNMFLTEQIKKNRWDMNVAALVTRDIRVALENRNPSVVYVSVDPATHAHSSFKVGWSIQGIFHETANIDWDIRDPAPGMAADCRLSPKFPVGGYLHTLQGHAVLVCL
nr:hypothetical protein [Gluconacetobacter johannae]